MKKTIILSLFCLYMIGACAQNKQFVVQGKLNGALADGRFIYSYYLYKDNIVLDSAKVVNGSYTLKGSVDQLVMLGLSKRNTVQMLNFLLVLERK